MAGSDDRTGARNSIDILDELLDALSRTTPTSQSAHEPTARADNSTTDGTSDSVAIDPPAPAHSSGAQHISKICFRGYKSLKRFDLHLSSMNILTGENNSGKSTALSALQILSAGLRVARRVKPKPMSTPDGQQLAYRVPTDKLSVSLENVHTDYGDSQATVCFEYSNGYSITLWFPSDGGCVLFVNPASGRLPETPSAFRKAFPTGVVCVPVLGPLEHNEPLVQEATVTGALATHRAARHFRNYWYQFPENFDQFSKLIEHTWPGVVIEPPELQMNASPPVLHMYCQENRITRELYWMGFGFQVWCQLLTHISRAGRDDVLVVDEPETYLHPIVQRRLLDILRQTGAQVVLATHSAPIVMDAGRDEVFYVVRSSREARPKATASEALAFQLGLRTLE
jgi:hypothetical protein